ncbi:lipase family protein [Porphyrobacter sp. AAP60]|uniref:lipase family protein n=1 Tax=Porphyrobacter sp. AAP60 TaxID=1523423 RepID=UPI0006B97834|nr:lipase family protein [Porphyrobacter sp. AAP60]
MHDFLQPVAAAVCVVAAVSAAPVAAQQWQGAWDTPYGQLRLVQNDDHVFGDYRDGTIEGIIDASTGRVRAVFVNPDGNIGYAEFRLDPDNRRFAGAWAWESAPLPAHNAGAADRRWTGTRTADTPPPIINFRLPGNRSRFINGAPAKYRQWITGFSRPAAASSAAGSGAGADTSHGLVHGRDLTPSKIATAFEMQRHVRAVSQRGDRQTSGDVAAAREYQRMGWQLLGRGIINDGGLRDSLLRAAVAKKGNAIVVAFRGTKGDSFRDTVTAGVLLDGNIRQVQPSFIPAAQRGQALVHAGFQGSYLKLRSQVLQGLSGQTGVHLYITGHSLGGAIAQLMAYDMAVNRGADFASITVITSGAPRVGNPTFADAFERAVPDNLRIVVNHDPVPAVPYVGGLYRHAGRLLVIGRDDGVLLQHDDMDVRGNAVQFGYHKNEDYFTAVQKLRDRAPRARALNPNGNAWASAAADREVTLSARPLADGVVKRLRR